MKDKQTLKLHFVKSKRNVEESQGLPHATGLIDTTVVIYHYSYRHHQ